MQPKNLKYYDWFNDFEPEILKNLNELLMADGIEPVKSLHGGWFKDNKWVNVGGGEYRNYWHVYLELWGDNVRNDSYDEVWFPNINDAAEWDYLYDEAEGFAISSNASHNYVDADTNWPKHLVTAVKKMLADNGFCTDPDGESILIWWCW